MHRLLAIAAYGIRHPVRLAVDGCGAMVRRATGRSALLDERPWMPWPTIRYLEATLRPDHHVFEYGSGGSTLFLARRVARVVSVEHDVAWAEMVRARLDALRLPVDYRPVAPLAEPDPDFASDVAGWRHRSFRPYVESIQSFADASFDLVIVDGRARLACLRAALPKVKPGGLLLLDNSERPKYASAAAMLAAHPCVTFEGLNPYQPDPGASTVWTIASPGA